MTFYSPNISQCQDRNPQYGYDNYMKYIHQRKDDQQRSLCDNHGHSAVETKDHTRLKTHTC
jgi:uncharacterized FAD-dependent dehydrogenase